MRRAIRSGASKVRGLASVGAVVAWGAAFAAGALGGCGPTPPVSGPSGQPASSGQGASSGKPAAPPASGSASLLPASKPFDACEGGLPLTMKYAGVLSDVRCDEERFPVMAETAKMLGVDCRYCHAPHPTDPKRELYPVMTPKKEIANWMKASLMAAIKPVDGSPMKCKSCHTDSAGKPVAKILGNPRSLEGAHEWMSLVMTTKFVVAATGEKLKCKHCHVGNYKSADWQSKVILTDHLPAR